MNFEDFPTLDKKGDKPNDIVIPVLEDITIEGLELKSELLVQYNRTRKLLHEAEYDFRTPLNQKAAVINAANSILNAMIKSEAELHSIEEVKKIESVLITTLRQFPELQEAFLAAYKLAGETYHVQ